MKLPHLLRVEEEAERFAPLLAAARAAGVRIGWLDLLAPVEAPAELARAAEAGAVRAVAATAGCNVALKPRRGPPVLLDLLREHFLGCVLVLVRAGAATMAAPAAGAGAREKLAPPPRLRPAGDGWEVAAVDAAARHLDTGKLLAALRRPHHPWGT